ncbi:MFS transporter [Paenibacillus alkaliterrae]|uniref:MFS transporter n=1 Tax=Paenibacillus alkaliterrae TaxID=320909 RepID=UPI001F35F9D3|nr:MFS transporter [Paenibacillus alkaliterrae]MCF2941790.1 MFS transporter [Paenibacillus alkaliterrae]
MLDHIFPQNKAVFWQTYVDSPEKQRQLQRRTLFIVGLAQIFGGAGLTAGITIGALLAQEMLRTESIAGVPSALFTLGSAAAALLIGRLSQRYGRRLGLAIGFLTGGIGAAGVVLAAVMPSIPLLFVSLFIYGAGTASNLLARYAGTDLVKPAQRAKAISMILMFTTFGAVAGPNLVDVMGSFAMSVGIPRLAGPFLLSAAAFIVAGLVLLVFLWPDPFLVAKAIARERFANQQSEAEEEKLLTSPSRKLAVGATVMILTQVVMIAIMTMTPVHMKHHGHGLGEVGLVIGIHVAAMYLPSLITGILVDKWGRTVMACVSGVTLLLSGLIAALAPADSMVLIMIALALLGLGWNFGLISGTAIIADAAPAATRAKTQGSIDVLIALAGASGGALSGMVVANSSYAILSLAGGILSLLLIPAVIWSRRDPNTSSS